MEYRDFEEWLIAMDDKLEQIARDVPSDIANALDYSPNSLSVLEKWLLSSFNSLDEIMRLDKYLIDRMSCYVGETFRKVSGGVWTIDYSNDESAFYGLPVIKKEGRAPRCPLTMLTASLDRRKGNYIENILINSI